MATLESIIEDVLADMDRPDLLSNARKNARQVLFECHAVAQFHHDIVAGASVTPVERVEAIPLPTNFRKLYNIVPKDGSGNELVIIYNQKQARPYVDEYGFADTVPTYNVGGGVCTLVHPMDMALPTSVQLMYYAFPTFTVANDGTVSTDSWMLEYNEAYFKAKLLGKLAGFTGNEALKRMASADEAASLLTLLAAQAEGI
jgi:hypothetical protein